jgi:hypothetical protein
MSLALGAAAGGATILGYIDTAVKVATFLISERLPATVNNIKSFFTKKNEKQPTNFNPEDAKDFVALLVIDPELLGDLTKKVKKGLIDYRECLKKAVRRQESAACDSRAEQSVCDQLNRIMDKNEDVLPSEYLRNQWASFRCVRV